MRLVWVVDPLRRVAHVYRQDGSETIVTAERALEGEDVLPGFACPLQTITNSSSLACENGACQS